MIELSATEYHQIQTILATHVSGHEVRAIGSRAHGTSKPWSDLDLVIMSTPIGKHWLNALKEAFEESDLPFMVDILLWDQLSTVFQAVVEDHYVVVQAVGINNNLTPRDMD